MGIRGSLLIISGGGMTQIEHAIGVIKAIKATTAAKFETVLGTSAGAIVGSLFMQYDQAITLLEGIIKKSDPSRWIKIKPFQAIKQIFGLSNYIADNSGLKEFLCETLTSQVANTCKVTMTDMGSYGKNWSIGNSITVGATPATVLASSSFQGIFPPVVIGGRMYGDGGVTNLCPLPKYMNIPEYDKIYIILTARTKLFPEVKCSRFLSNLFKLIDKSLQREIAQINELALHEASNVVVFHPDQWVKSANFLGWSKNFEQIDESYNAALDILEQKGFV